MSDAHEALIQTLLARGGPDCRLTSSGERPWASITFEGARHVVEVELLAEAADPFMEDIEEAAFDLRHHLLADLAVVSRDVPVDGRVRVRFEALTLAEA